MNAQVSDLNIVVVTGVSSRFFGQKFPKGMFDVPESFRNALAMNEEGRERAGQALADALAARGWNAVDLALHADIPDAATVRTFMAGGSWPWASTRARMERALGLEPGTLDRIAKGSSGRPSADGLDPVESAIEASPNLSRGQKLRLRGLYVDMLDDQARETPTG